MALKSANKVDTNRVELEIEVGAEEFEKAVSAAYKKNVGKINVPGFRKGKAPRAIIEKIYGTGVFYEDAVNEIYPTALEAAIDESGYEYVEDKIDFDVTSVGADGLKFKATITVQPEIELTEYKGLKAAKKAVSVKEADITAELAKMQDRNSRLVTVEDRAAENGDTVVFDFDGYVDEVAFEGGKSENFSLVLGSGQFIPGFEDQIVGKKPGEEFDVNVTFPEEYHATELAGKPAVFKCKLHEVKTKELPELNDDFAKDCSEFDTLDEL
ncbi:MAG: trigger factor, partial [Clostridia bacterium]|nr:trigger factor [Clostridia bacterium]